MNHDPYDLSDVPPDAVTRARQLLQDASRNMMLCGESGIAMGWWVESHTLGCRNAADETEENWWASHWKIFSEYENDGISRIMADEASGAFVTMTPTKTSMGATRQRRVKPNKMKLAQAERLAARVEKTLAPYSDFILVVGSVRRKAPTVGDIELVVLPKDLEEFLKILEEEGFHGGKRKQTGIVSRMPIEIYLAHDPKELGAMVMWFTGDYQWNIAMNSIAKRRGLKRNQYGIWKGAKPVLQSDDEVDFFEFLDVRYHEPEERSLAARGKTKKAKMGDGSDRFWDDEEE